MITIKKNAIIIKHDGGDFQKHRRGYEKGGSVFQERDSRLEDRKGEHRLGGRD
jgi:hypothetical protein